MIEVACRFHDGARAAAESGSLCFYRDGTIVRSRPHAARVAVGEVEVSDRIGTIPRRVEFADGVIAEVDDNDVLDQALRFAGASGGSGALLYWLESRWQWVGPGIVLAIVLGFLLVDRGIPWLAEVGAQRAPGVVRSDLGERSLADLDERYLAPSTLGSDEQARWQQRFAALQQDAGFGHAVRLELRQAPELGPNAFALPGDIVIMTDDLIELAAHEEEVLAVLAHEMGHIEHRHALQMALRRSALRAALLAVTGNSGSLANEIPRVLLGAHYSREFEIEADEAARDYMLAAGIPLYRFPGILDRMEAEVGPNNQNHLLATHPPNEERKRIFNEAEE